MIRLLIFLNILVFGAWIFADPTQIKQLDQNFLVSWQSLMEGRYWTLITSVFSHKMILHFLLNMFVLNSFGPIVLRAVGLSAFLVFYLIAGAMGSLFHALFSNFLMAQPELSALGASGAIAGLILLFSLMFPKEKILLFAIIPMPAIIGALAFIGFDIWGLVSQVQGGGLPIGHGAHLGGAFTGIIYYFFFVRTR